MRLTALGCIAVMLLAGCAGPSGSQDVQDETTVPGNPARDPSSPAFRPHVVVAVIDTGVNPYHVEFQEQYEDAPPEAYIPEYPEVKVLNLSEWESGSANRAGADEAIWSNTESGVLYRYNGTKIVGHISFGSDLPGSGHGTMTSSRATGNTISVGGTAVRLVHVQGFSAESVRWAADQPWIDMISISSGITAGGLVPVAGNVISQAEIDAFQYAAHKKPFFASSGNGVGNAGLLGFPAWTRGPSGAPDVISVGANENGRMNIWHNWHPYIVGDGCGNPSAQDNTAQEIANTGGGTSSATPFSAGMGAAMLLEARRILGDSHVGIRYSETPIESFSSWDSLSSADATIVLSQGDPARHNITNGPLADGVFTQQEFKDVLYHTAISGGTDDASDGDDCQTLARGTVPGDDVPEPARQQFNGYGEVNSLSLEAALPVLLGTASNPDRPDDDMWYGHFHMLRTTTDL